MRMRGVSHTLTSCPFFRDHLTDSSDPVLGGGQHRFRTDDGGAVDTSRATASQPQRVVHVPPAKNRQPLCLRSQFASNARRIGAA